MKKENLENHFSDSHRLSHRHCHSARHHQLRSLLTELTAYSRKTSSPLSLIDYFYLPSFLANFRPADRLPGNSAKMKEEAFYF